MSKREIRKRDGRVLPFDESKIADAIFKAACAVGGSDRSMADELSAVVTMFLDKNYEDRVPGIEDIQDLVEKVLIETGHAKTAKAYILYRDRRARIREQHAGAEAHGEQVEHDRHVAPGGRRPSRRGADLGQGEASPPRSSRRRTSTRPLADEIARAVEEKIFASGMRRISTSLIRELADNELFERGLSQAPRDAQRDRHAAATTSRSSSISKSKENSNITANNPEAINLAIAETTLKQFASRKSSPATSPTRTCKAWCTSTTSATPPASTARSHSPRIPQEIRPGARQPRHRSRLRPSTRARSPAT